MSKKEKILSLVGVFHLVLVCFGAASIRFYPMGKFGEIFDIYSQLSGAGAGFGFFAPEVGSGLQALFDVEKNGKIETHRIEPEGNREAFLRVGNIISLLSRDFEKEKARRVIVASWVGKVMSQNPGSNKVTLRLQRINLPKMEEYRQGVRRDWETFYQAEFVRNNTNTAKAGG